MERAIELLEALGLPVRLVVDADQVFEGMSLPVLVDRIPGAGPLGGIYTGLSAAKARNCFFLPADMPLVRPALFKLMMKSTAGWDAIIPLDREGKLHPLSAYYSRKCVDFARVLLESGERRVGGLLEDRNLRVLKLPVKDFGISDDCFFNVNTPSDYKELLGMSTGSGSELLADCVSGHLT